MIPDDLNPNIHGDEDEITSHKVHVNIKISNPKSQSFPGDEDEIMSQEVQVIFNSNPIIRGDEGEIMSKEVRINIKSQS